MNDILTTLKMEYAYCFILLRQGYEVTGMISSVRKDIIIVKVDKIRRVDGSVIEPKSNIPLAISDIVTAFPTEMTIAKK